MTKANSLGIATTGTQYYDGTATYTGITGTTGQLFVAATSAAPSFASSTNIDFSFTNATAGTTRKLTVSSSDNTAAVSGASFVASVAGTTQTGDAYSLYAVGSTRSYALGPDTSDSQKLKITTTNAATVNPSSGSTLFTMDSVGLITLATALPVGSGGTSSTSFNIYGPVVAASTTTGALTSVAPSATSGIPFISQGAAANPTFGTAVVAGGGTAATSFSVNGVVVSNTTTTGALAALTLTNGQLVIGSTGTTPVAAAIIEGPNITVTNGTGSITISSSPVVEVVSYENVNSSPYVVAATDYFLSVDTTSSRTIQLPNAPTTNRCFLIKDRSGSSATNNITVTTVGGVVNIDGAASRTLNTNYASISLLFNGTSYEVY